MSGGVKMHLKSVSVYVNLSKNSRSPQYGAYKTSVPFLPRILFALFLACERCLPATERLLIFSALYALE